VFRIFSRNCNRQCTWGWGGGQWMILFWGFFFFFFVVFAQIIYVGNIFFFVPQNGIPAAARPLGPFRLAVPRALYCDADRNCVLGMCSVRGVCCGGRLGPLTCVAVFLIVFFDCCSFGSVSLTTTHMMPPPTSIHTLISGFRNLAWLLLKMCRDSLGAAVERGFRDRGLRGAPRDPAGIVPDVPPLLPGRHVQRVVSGSSPRTPWVPAVSLRSDHLFL
jgi:hypothetical protein